MGARARRRPGSSAIALVLVVLAVGWIVAGSLKRDESGLSLGPLSGGFDLDEGRVGVGTLTLVTGKSVYAATLVYARGATASANLSLDLARLDESLTRLDEPAFPEGTPQDVRDLYARACESAPCANETTRIAAGETKVLDLLANASRALSDALGLSNATAEGRVVAGRESTIIVQITQSRLGEADAQADAKERLDEAMLDARDALVEACEERGNLTGLACPDLYVPFSVAAKLDWSPGPRLKEAPPVDTFVVGPLSWRTANATSLVEAERPGRAALPLEAVFGATPVYLPLRVLYWAIALWAVGLAYNRVLERAGLAASLPVAAFGALTLLVVLLAVAFRKLLFGSVTATVVLPFVALYVLVFVAYVAFAPGPVHSGSRLAGTLANAAAALALVAAAVVAYAYLREDFVSSLYENASAGVATLALVAMLASGLLVVLLLAWPTALRRAVAARTAQQLATVPAAPEVPELGADWSPPGPTWTDRLVILLTPPPLERRILVGRWARAPGVAEREYAVREALGDVYWLTHRLKATRRAMRLRFRSMVPAPMRNRDVLRELFRSPRIGLRFARLARAATLAEWGAWFYAAGGALARRSASETREDAERDIAPGHFTLEVARAAATYVELRASHREAVKAARREAQGDRAWYIHGRVELTAAQAQ